MAERQCARDCTAPAQTRGYCGHHYRYMLHTGRFGYQSADDVRAHVLALRGLGWTYAQISEASGASTWTAHQLAIGNLKQVWQESRTAILSVPLVARESHRGTDPTGSMRRIHALLWMGWPVREIAARTGAKPSTIYAISHRGGGGGHRTLSHRMAKRIAAVYDELSHLQGPSKQTATKARARGYAPPLAWDDIDDPKARPHGVRRSA